MKILSKKGRKKKGNFKICIKRESKERKGEEMKERISCFRCREKGKETKKKKE